MHQIIVDLLHPDQKNLSDLVDQLHIGFYFIFCLIIFCETGLVVTPFLPGDSLLFAAGTLAGGLSMNGGLNIYMLVIILFIAAFAGDNTNYFIGRFTGPKIFTSNNRFVNKEYLVKTHNFYERNGGKTIIIARFIPIIRTFAPFVAGIGTMAYSRFLLFSFLGNLFWINLFLWAGFLLGTNAWVQQHFTIVELTIIVISLLPVFYGIIQRIFISKNT